jgi:hypothetical protein
MEYIGVEVMQSSHANHLDRSIHKANHLQPIEEGTAQPCGHKNWTV